MSRRSISPRHPRNLAHLLAIVWWVLALGCDRDSAQGGEPSARAAQGLGLPVASRLELERPTQLDSATAFELIATFDGATLLWAERGSRGAVKAQHLTSSGGLKGEPVTLVSGRSTAGTVTDLVAARLESGTALAWIERIGGEARASATIAGAASAQVVDLGPAWHTQKMLRGNIALAPTGDEALVFARGPREACTEGQRDCFGFGLHRITRQGVDNGRGLPLSVPVPCSQQSTHVAVRDGHWYYGVCTLHDSVPVTTLFRIQFDPEYAEAEQLMPGCRPRGLFEHEHRIWLSGDCAGKPRAASVEQNPETTMDLSDVRFVCHARPLLEGTGFELRLSQPRGALQDLVHEPWVSEGARAVWAGRALLVAAQEGGQIRLTRYSCP